MALKNSYSKEVLEHFKNPKNMGSMKNPDGIGKVGNPICGDTMHLYIKIKNNKITDIKFETFGCVAAIATSSITTQMAKGKSIKSALKITKKRIAKEIGGLPPQKIHCSILADDALKEAIYNYLTKNKLKVPKELNKEHKLISKRTY